MKQGTSLRQLRPTLHWQNGVTSIAAGNNWFSATACFDASSCLRLHGKTALAELAGLLFRLYPGIREQVGICHEVQIGSREFTARAVKGFEHAGIELLDSSGAWVIDETAVYDLQRWCAGQGGVQLILAEKDDLTGCVLKFSNNDLSLVMQSAGHSQLIFATTRPEELIRALLAIAESSAINKQKSQLETGIHDHYLEFQYHPEKGRYRVVHYGPGFNQELSAVSSSSLVRLAAAIDSCLVKGEYHGSLTQAV